VAVSVSDLGYVAAGSGIRAPEIAGALHARLNGLGRLLLRSALREGVRRWPLSVRGCPSTVKGTRRSFRIAPQNDLQDLPLSVGASAPLRSETKGQAGACPDRTWAIP
jgi:hypothetical protein